MKKNWFEWFHVIYATVVIATAFSAIFPEKPELRELILLIAFVTYSVILLIFLIYFTFTYSRKARYAEATKCMHTALHAARDAYHYLDWCRSKDHDDVVFDENRLCMYMKTVLTSISEAFSIVAGVKCRVSIKVLGQNTDNQLYVRTLARDEVSQTQCDKRDLSESNKHLVTKNTDFHLITEGLSDYFFEGDLEHYPNYMNTSIDEHDGLRGQKWSLPYKSTIVWPIRYVFNRHERDDSQGNCQEDIYGFLTVDSSSKNAFSERYDVQMGATLADALFPVMNAYSNKA
jgi:hypothetical protein